ncbi:hypothetical protein C8F01DRAFT_669411 [Mycena amicta]|nr:hypothetical protein C8F01DRAFT_669411 [Mycena amicta]
MLAHTVAKGLCSDVGRSSDTHPYHPATKGKTSRSIYTLESPDTPFLTILREKRYHPPRLRHPNTQHSASYPGRPLCSLQSEGSSSYAGSGFVYGIRAVVAQRTSFTWAERTTATTTTMTVVSVPNPPCPLRATGERCGTLPAFPGLFAMSVVNPNPARMHTPLLATKYGIIATWTEARKMDDLKPGCVTLLSHSLLVSIGFTAQRPTSSRQAGQVTIVGGDPCSHPPSLPSSGSPNPDCAGRRDTDDDRDGPDHFPASVPKPRLLRSSSRHSLHFCSPIRRFIANHIVLSYEYAQRPTTQGMIKDMRGEIRGERTIHPDFTLTAH